MLKEITNTHDTTLNTLRCKVETSTTQQTNLLQSNPSPTREMQTVAKTTEQYGHNPLNNLVYLKSLLKSPNNLYDSVQKTPPLNTARQPFLRESRFQLSELSHKFLIPSPSYIP